MFRYLCEHQEGQSKYYESDLFPADISTDRDSGSDSGHGSVIIMFLHVNITSKTTQMLFINYPFSHQSGGLSRLAQVTAHTGNGTS